jgi:membrane-bound serine protease (ClpP class)
MRLLFFVLILFVSSLGASSLGKSEEQIQENFNRFIHPSPDSNTIGYIYIGDHESEINQSTWLYVKQALEFYKKNPPIFIILVLNTPGGEVFAAQKIADALKEMDTQYNIPIVAYINNWAISAGAMLAYSGRFITVAKDGSMGAAEPVLMGESGKMESASEKMNSVLRADFASRASYFDRNPLIAQAMVDKDFIVVIRDGKIIHLENENQLQLNGPHPDVVISPKGKLLTLNADELVAFGVAEVVVPPLKLDPITAEETEKGVWPAKKMALFHTSFFSSIPNPTIHAFQMDWKTKFFVFLATPMISSLLFMGLLIGGYMELNHPGLSFPGFVAALSLFLLALSTYSLQIIHWLELILLLAGLALILLELFILPTFGLLGIFGIFLFFIGLFAMLVPGLTSINFEWGSPGVYGEGEYFLHRLAWLSGALIISTAIIFLLARYVLPRFSAWNPLVLAGNEQDASEGYRAGNDPKSFPPIGSHGTVFATLRPAGKVTVNNSIYDALSTGDFIEEGENVIVSKIEEGVIFVKKREL